MGVGNRKRNRHRLLELIERNGPISRADLSRLTRLSLPSVSEIVDELVQFDLIKWVGEGNSTGGRPPKLIEFNARRGAVLAVDLSGSTPALGVFLLDGTMVSQIELENRAQEDVITLLVQEARTMMQRMGQEGCDVLAMGVAAPGVTDPVRGEVSFAPAVGWWQTPVKEQLQQALGIPVVVDNDVNAAALAERLYGDGGGYKTFAVVLIGTGLGMGIVMNGRVHRGRSFQAGEIGYMWVDGNSRSTDKMGTLESYLSIPSIAKDYQVLTSGVESSNTANPDETSRDRDLINRLVSDLRSGDHRAEKFMDQRINVMAKALVNVYLVLAPEVIFLAGPETALLRQILPALEQRVQEVSPLHPFIRVSGLSERSGLIGASALASDEAKKRLIGMNVGTGVGE